jgi:predicted ArsR family transcriptional regulator
MARMFDGYESYLHYKLVLSFLEKQPRILKEIQEKFDFTHNRAYQIMQVLLNHGIVKVHSYEPGVSGRAVRYRLTKQNV